MYSCHGRGLEASLIICADHDHDNKNLKNLRRTGARERREARSDRFTVRTHTYMMAVVRLRQRSAHVSS